MNKRHYEHTLPNIRGSLSNTYCEKQDRLSASPKNNIIFFLISTLYFK